MAFETVKFEDITASDLLALVDSGVTESRILEYKAAMYGRDDQGRREALKDITAFANTDGGHLIIGISEKNGALALSEGIDGVSIMPISGRMVSGLAHTPATTILPPRACLSPYWPIGFTA